MTTSNRPSAATDASADHRPQVSPETEPSRDERVKRPPSEAELRPALPPEVQGLVEPPVAAILEDVCEDERVKRPPLEPVIPPKVRALFGEPPLLPGEDRAAYEALLGGGAGPRPEGHGRVAQRERHRRLRLGGRAPQAPQGALPHAACGNRAVQPARARPGEEGQGSAGLPAPRPAPEQRLDAQRPHGRHLSRSSTRCSRPH